MRTVSLKLADSILEELDQLLLEHRFTTRTEFIREAIRDKLKALEQQKFEAEVRHYLREKKAQKHTQAYDDVFSELEKKFTELSQ